MDYINELTIEIENSQKSSNIVPASRVSPISSEEADAPGHLRLYLENDENCTKDNMDFKNLRTFVYIETENESDDEKASNDSGKPSSEYLDSRKPSLTNTIDDSQTEMDEEEFQYFT